ncbi:hypothetical protein TSAR_000991 [Trichomalopsis sarcophagae]|uniref:Uncharacterized protein n=1 Tax=Trichomalopsis sarcophagae TaxID=543379 RepID=A0A232F5T8_9HYME|nr:hypothetical protein TSAR_000991 [Trichomalopsis sarcophagae]
MGFVELNERRIQKFARVLEGTIALRVSRKQTSLICTCEVNSSTNCFLAWIRRLAGASANESKQFIHKDCLRSGGTFSLGARKMQNRKCFPCK